MYKSLIMSFWLLFLQACGHREPVYIESSQELCPQPVKPELPKVQGDLADEKTQELLYERELQIRDYIKRLENTVLCYAKQV